MEQKTNATFTKQHVAAPEFQPSTFSTVRKSDQAHHNSLGYKNGSDSNNNFLNNRFSSLSSGYQKDRKGSAGRFDNSTSSFFSARRANFTAQKAFQTQHHPHHHGSFHRTSSSGSDKSQGNERNVRSLNSKEKEYVRNKAVNNTNSRIVSHHGQGIFIDQEKAAQESVKALETLQQIQEAKPGNKRALLVDLPPYLYSIPALASFFEPYGEVAMLQILPQKRMWDADLIDLLGASMCNRLANQSLCAIVEFYSARMAKFIIGILRKRLPILKFRCALLKPSAAIELTNQAENLGLINVVVMKNKTKSKDSAGSASGEVDSDDEVGLTVAPADNRQRQSDSESGLEEMSSNSCSNNRRDSRGRTHPSSDHDGYQQSSENDESNQTSSQSPSSDSGDLPRQEGGQRFVTSFRIKLNK